MNLHINLKEIDKKILSFQFEDGLLDLLIGTLFSLAAMNVILNGSSYLFIPIIGAGLVSVFAVRKYVTSPRLGTVKLGKSGKRREHIVWIIIAFSILFNVIFEYITRYGYYAGNRNTLFAHSIYSAKLLIVFIFIAYFTNFKRLYLYGILIAATFPISKIFQLKNAIDDYREAFLIPGLIIFAIGLFHFVRFIKKYPLSLE